MKKGIFTAAVAAILLFAPMRTQAAEALVAEAEEIIVVDDTVVEDSTVSLLTDEAAFAEAAGVDTLVVEEAAAVEQEAEAAPVETPVEVQVVEQEAAPAEAQVAEVTEVQVTEAPVVEAEAEQEAEQVETPVEAPVEAETEEGTEEVVTAEMQGTSQAPYFELSDGNTAYCVNPDLMHPSEQVEYTASASEDESYDDIAINSYLVVEGGADETSANHATQLAIWSMIDDSTDYAAIAESNGVKALYDTMFAEIADRESYTVERHVYTTNDVTVRGGHYQTLMSFSVAHVIDAVVPETPEEPEEQPTPEVPEIPSEQPTEEVVVEEENEEEPVVITTVPVLSATERVQTGEGNLTLVLSALLLFSMISFVAVNRR